MLTSLQSCITHRVALTGQLVRPGVKQWQQGRQRGQFEPERECPGCAQSILSDYVAGFIPSPVRKHALLESSRSIHQLPGSVVSAMIIDLRRDPHHFYSHVRAAYQRISTADPRQTIPQKEYRGPNLSMRAFRLEDGGALESLESEVVSLSRTIFYHYHRIMCCWQTLSIG